MLNLQRIFQLLSGQRLDLKPYLEVKGRDKMATKDKQAFLTNHLLAFGIAGDEPITNTLKLNEAGIIVDHANPEAQQTGKPCWMRPPAAVRSSFWALTRHRMPS